MRTHSSDRSSWGKSHHNAVVGTFNASSSAPFCTDMIAGLAVVCAPCWRFWAPSMHHLLGWVVGHWLALLLAMVAAYGATPRQLRADWPWLGWCFSMLRRWCFSSSVRPTHFSSTFAVGIDFENFCTFAFILCKNACSYGLHHVGNMSNLYKPLYGMKAYRLSFHVVSGVCANYESTKYYLATYKSTSTFWSLWAKSSVKR